MSYMHARGVTAHFWGTLVLTALSVSSAGRAAASDDAAPGAAAPTMTSPNSPNSSKSPSKKAPAQKKPTIQELERRIQLLEQRLDEQQRLTAAALQSIAAAQVAATAPQPPTAQRAVGQTPPGQEAAAQQAGTAAAQQPQQEPLAAAQVAAAAPQPLQQAHQAPPGTAPAQAAQTERQSPPQQHPVTVQQAASATVSGPQIFAGPGGFSFQSPDGADQIRFHGEFDFDGRFYNDDLTPDGSRSTWLLRRVRPIVEGTFANIFDFRFNPDFAGGKTVVQDAFVAARFDPLFVVTAGKFKEPFGLERLQLSPNNRFIELGLPSDLVPNRDLGLQVSGTYAFSTGTLIYQLGWFNGVVDGSSTDANAVPDVDNNDGKDWAARVFAEPFSKSAETSLRGLGAGVAVSYVNQIGSPANTLLPTYKTETQRNFFGYDGTRTASGATPAAGATYADGRRVRISPQAYYYYKSLGLLSEYVTESQDVARTVGAGAAAFTRRATVKPESWQLMATFLVTGDHATFGTVKPNRPFVVGQPGWGAWEIAARVSELKLNAATFTDVSGGRVGSWFADPGSQAGRAFAWTAGLNWYLTQNVAWYLDYTVTRFDGGAQDGAERANESAFFTRFQVAF